MCNFGKKIFPVLRQMRKKKQRKTVQNSKELAISWKPYSEFVWTLRSLVFFNNFLLIDATDKSKISSDQKRFFITLSLYPLSFFANTPFKPLGCSLIWIISDLTTNLLAIHWYQSYFSKIAVASEKANFAQRIPAQRYKIFLQTLFKCLDHWVTSEKQ